MTGSDDGSFNRNQNADAEDPIKLKDDDKPSKFVRVVIVSAYIFSVSFAAILLSAYYLIFWKPTQEHAEMLQGMDINGGDEITHKSCS